MSLVDTLMQSLGPDTVDQIRRQLGTDESTARDATGAAVGALVGGLAKNARSRNGADALLGALKRDHDGSVLNQMSSLLGSGDLGDGAGILRHVLGQKQIGVKKAISQDTGLGSDSVGKLLTMLAPLVMGALGQQTRKRGLDASSLSDMLVQEKKELHQRQPAGMGAFDQILDADGDGDVDLGDLLKGGSSLLGKFLNR